QVLVDYINGDPDRPIVTAFVPDVNNMPAWKLPENRALSGIVTRSLGRGATTNHLAFDDSQDRQQVQLASDHANSSLSLGYITRIEGNAGRQEARGEGFELRTDLWGVLRAFGMLITTSIREKAAGKVKDMGEAIARLTGARDIHESIAQQARRHDAQDAKGDQADVTEAMKRANAELRGKGSGGADEFPEFEAPHLTLSSAAGIQSTAEESTHIASEKDTALTAGRHLSFAAAESFFASVRGKIALYAQKAITLITPGGIYIESRDAFIRLIANEVAEIICRKGWLKLQSPVGIEFQGGASVARLSDDGFKVYTAGRVVLHAADHSTDDPVSRPVDFPVTSDNPGKLAAHHVLVESGGGFTVPNQPYRLTLDDGQVIQGVTNELGELQMATSNAVSFGMIEFMSQSSPEDVIGMTKISVHRDASLPPPPPPPVPAQRTAQIGGKAISTPGEGPTTQGQPARYITCDPMNFGLRRYRILNDAKAEQSPADRRRSNIEYPVAKQYTAAVKPKLMDINWIDLDGKSADDMQAIVAPAVQEALWAALQDGPFGLPAGTSADAKPGAMPAIEIIGPAKAPKYGMEPTNEGGFIAIYWSVAVAQFRIKNIIDRLRSDRNDFWITELAVTLYHEARHCQQNTGLFPSSIPIRATIENFRIWRNTTS
ncbi:type VI secretion system Vgr family protein, partial [Paraburkholderia oxyphila]|uniref:type VI secretion system Vgr family protein n=1 Tax=Paraburkholderia oxyphila TaxID=614212 RepID=UPI001C3F1A87